jgi:hypothetical protein
MGMYTDWGNLKIVSCGAWREGRTRQLNGYRWNGRVGGVHFGVKAQGGFVGRAMACGGPGRQLGEAEKFR